MKLVRLALILLSLQFLGVSQAEAQQAEGDADISYGSDTAPGVEASATVPGYEVTNTPIENQAGTGAVPSVTTTSGPTGPLVVAVSAHNCTPFTTSTGVDLDLELTESAGGDCLSFSTPAPVERLADRSTPGNRRDRGPSLEDLVRTAADRAIALAVRPQLKVAPDGVGLTGLPSYFWLAVPPRPISASASAGGITVIAEASPAQYLWTFGDGDDLVTTTSGRPWTRDLPGNIDHTYETRGRYELSVEVIYRARWRLDGGPWQSLGFFSTTDSRTYPVRQVVAVLVEPDPTR
jgi:PKD domain